MAFESSAQSKCGGMEGSKCGPSQPEAQIPSKLFDESMTNAAMFGKTLDKWFKVIDSDDDGSLSLNELRVFAGDTKQDAAPRTVAAIAHSNFEVFQNLDFNKTSGDLVGFDLSDKSSLVNGLTERTKQQGVSRTDLTVLNRLSSGDGAAKLLGDFRSEQRKLGVVTGVAGAGSAAVVLLGIALGGPIGIGVGIVSVGASLFGFKGSWDSLAGNNLDALKKEVEQRQKMLRSSGLIIPAPTGK